jgi:putative transposase
VNGPKVAATWGLELLAKSRIRILTTEPDPTSEPAKTTEALTA